MKQLLEILYGNLDKKPILFLPIFFSLAFGIYYFSNLTPNDWYKHYVYLADSFIKGRVDVPQIPEFYQDVINFNGKKFLPFGPIPAVFLMPLVAFFGTGLSEVKVSMVIGAVNVVLVWLILSKLSLNAISRLLLTAGFAFGTVHFYAAITGTVWFFAHIMAVFFLLLAILEFFGQRRPVLLGFLTGCAFLSREFSVVVYFVELHPTDKIKKITDKIDSDFTANKTIKEIAKRRNPNIDWNKKNKEPLRENYIRSQLTWSKKQRLILPQNCPKDKINLSNNFNNYYTDLYICSPDNLCMMIKNPVQYAIKKSKAYKNK